jgi:hypothetical protein
VALDASAIIRLDSLDASVTSRIVNASHRGLLLDMPEPRPVGTRIHVRVSIQDPRFEIEVSGIIVHVEAPRALPPGPGERDGTEKDGAAGSRSARVGVYLTTVGPDWAALCRRLANATKGGPPQPAGR